MGLDDRIGRKFLHPGPGYGGSCFPKDTQALVRIAQENGASSRIVEAVIEVNEAQKARMIKKIRSAIGGNESGKTIAVLGLTFKPETDDMRDAPSLAILPKLIENGCHINAHDPQGIDEAKKLLPSEVRYFTDIYTALEDVDAVVLMTEWNMYRNLDMSLIREKLKQPVFIDLRNVYEPDSMKTLGFDYHCIGR
jgi:UDPglucose 6-dehydrogenase